MPDGTHRVITRTVVEDDVDAESEPSRTLNYTATEEVTATTTPSFADVHPNLPFKDCPHPLFVAEQLGVDRRLLLNRKRQLKMYRVWMQGRFEKL